MRTTTSCAITKCRTTYDHGKFPFVFDVLFPEEGTPAGYGYVDLCKSPQKQIDLMNQAILKNTLASATPRFFVRSDGAVNENEYADWTRPFVHTNGNLGSDSIAPIQTAGLDSVYVAILQSKIAEMKETLSHGRRHERPHDRLRPVDGAHPGRLPSIVTISQSRRSFLPAQSASLTGFPTRTA